MTPQVSEALLELTKLARTRPALRGPAALLGKILPTLLGEPTGEPPPALTAEKAGAKLAAGLPLLRGEEARLDERAFRARWVALCTALAEDREGDSPRALAAAIRDGRLAPQEMLAEVLAGRPEGTLARAESLGLDPALTATALRLALFPVLTRWAAALAALRQGTDWEQGFCPTCGSWPLLGEFRGLEQVRHLRCGLCASGWEFPRLRCPFCGTADHRQLGYLHAEGEEASRRAAVCDACRGYVKTVATLAPLSEPALLVADLATTHLDLAAAERGYFAG
jgi:FdhE protein